MKNNIDFYQHYANADQHPKFKTLREKFGWAGEGKFWALNNRIAQAEDCRLDISKKYNKSALASDLDFNIAELDEFIAFLSADCELIKECEPGVFITDIVQENFEKVSENREKARSRKQRYLEKVSKVRPNLLKHFKGSGDGTHSKVKESKGKGKVKESKGKETNYLTRKNTFSGEKTVKNDETYITKKKKKLSGKKLSTFLQFWNAFDYKKGKASAADAWLNTTLTDTLVLKIIVEAKRTARNRHKMISEGKTPIFPQGWISGRRWEDEDTEQKRETVMEYKKRIKDEK